MRQIEIFDTTLRDGEQAPGAALTAAAKLEVARALADLGVDTIEAGFPAASDGEAAAVRQIAQEVTGVTMAALARATDSDVDIAAKALAPAQRKRIHVFIGTSDIHLERKLRITPHECLLRVERAVHRAMEHADEVEFSAEDATRTDIHFLGTVYQVAAAAGARIMNIPDTVGYAQPDEFARYCARYSRRVDRIQRRHPRVGALPQRSRAGRREHACRDRGRRVTGACHDERYRRARRQRVARGDGHGAPLPRGLVWRGHQSEYRAHRPDEPPRVRATGILVQPNKAVVGANAFAHASGIHQDGVIKDPRTYEIMTPESVGWEARRIVVSKLSGRAGLAARLAELGVPLHGEELDNAYRLAMRRADEVHELDERDLITISAESRRKSVIAPATLPAAS
jgi:2-isopropylmalate synthase